MHAPVRSSRTCCLQLMPLLLFTVTQCICAPCCLLLMPPRLLFTAAQDAAPPVVRKRVMSAVVVQGAEEGAVEEGQQVGQPGGGCRAPRREP